MIDFQKLKNFIHRISAFLAILYYRHPAAEIKVIGVTGTDGKTTTVHLIHHILKTAGKKVSFISSVTASVAGENYDTGFHVTTPDAWMLQKLLRKAVNAKEEYLIIEVTSHSLDQNRVMGINFAVGVLTNITREHLDYHKNYFNLLKTKEKLFKNTEVAILNKDDESYKYLDSSKYKNTMTYAIKKDADVTWTKFHFSTSLPGEYNRYNCLAAIACAKKLGIADGIIRNSIKKFTGVIGRFEKISNKFGITIIIDFAHTPNALKQVLSTVKPMVKGKLIHVFGCAGKRDYKKRPVMGEISARNANLIVLTEEDYRNENLDNIIDAIAQGCKKENAIELAPVNGQNTANKKIFFRIPSRKLAIEFAITKLARNGDTVILTGKAHEKSLCRGNVEFPWNEYEAVKHALKILSA